MAKQTEYTDEALLRMLSSADQSQRAADLLFQQYYTPVCRQIIRIIKDPVATEDVAQEVFLQLWRKRYSINIQTSLSAYLQRAARNRALNYLRDQKIDLRNASLEMELESNTRNALQLLDSDNLQQDIDEAIDNLPERSRLVFVLSRFEDLTHQQIADLLEISKKTVENQMSRALRLLRERLRKYL